VKKIPGSAGDPRRPSQNQSLRAQHNRLLKFTPLSFQIFTPEFFVALRRPLARRLALRQ
jgi:hypothetical protein